MILCRTQTAWTAYYGSRYAIAIRWQIRSYRVVRYDGQFCAKFDENTSTLANCISTAAQHSPNTAILCRTQTGPTAYNGSLCAIAIQWQIRNYRLVRYEGQFCASFDENISALANCISTSALHSPTTAILCPSQPCLTASIGSLRTTAFQCHAP